MKVVYNWLKEYVGDAMPSPEKLDKLLTFHAFEIDGREDVHGEEVFDVKILPDRSSDCLSHRGIAREIASLIGVPLAHDPFTDSITPTPKTDKITVTIEDPTYCRRFMGALITGVSISESPEWLKQRLMSLGQRPINNVVDATNYVMLALGQPLHAYDAGKLSHDDGIWRVGVRMAHEGETITSLSGDVYQLDTSVQLIVDEQVDKPVSIAGIKGGIEALVDSQTTAIILEAANFDPQITRRAAQLLKLQTDASKRFENDIAPALTSYGLKAVVDLICEIADGTCDGYVDNYPHPVSRQPVPFTRSQTNALLGLALTKDTIEDILTRLGFSYVYTDEVWMVTSPFERTDITIPEDIIAEIGRVYGYKHVVALIPESIPLHEYNARHYYSEKIRSLLTGQGFSEVITSSFRKKDQIELQNALASDKSYLRSSLKENIREVLDKNMPNLDLLGLDQLQVFEIGTVFEKTTDVQDVTEYMSLAIGVRTRQQGYTPKDDAHLKEKLSVLEMTLGTTVNAVIETGVLECNLSSLIASFVVPTTYDPIMEQHGCIFAPYSTYPFVSRDIALWVPETQTAHDVESLIRTHSGSLLISVRLFDEFKKDTQISYAFRLIFQAMDRTLTDEEVGNIMKDIVDVCQKQGYTVR